MEQADVVFFVLTESGAAMVEPGRGLWGLLAGFQVEPVFAKERIDALPGAPPPLKETLRRLYAYTPPAGERPDAFLAALGTVLREQALVRSIWFQPKLASQPTGPQHQGYLWPPVDPTGANPSATPWGVSSTSLGTAPECEGDGATIWIVERGWHRSDIADSMKVEGLPEPALLFGSCSDDPVDRNHGTRDLSVIAMERGDGHTGWGIAPRATLKLAATGAAGTGVHPIYSRILDIAAVAEVGDILLVEEQFWASYGGSSTDQRECCVDVCPLMRLLLRYAVRRGMVPILPAGNGSGELTAMSIPWTSSKQTFLLTLLMGKKLLSPPDKLLKLVKVPPWSESNVIRVGGVELPSTKRTESNHGTGVHLFAWYSQVFARHVDVVGTTRFTTTGQYGGTSAAAAIVAGVAGVAQAMQVKKTGVRRRSSAMRDLLEYGGTSSGAPSADDVGVMPNLDQIRLAIEKGLV